MSRTRRLIGGIATSFVSRGLAALAPLVTVPAALGFLGVGPYGAWAAALALTSFAAFADLGIGAGLMTKLADALAVGDRARASRLIASGYAAVGSLCALVLVALWSLAPFVDWSVLITGTREEPGVETRGIVLVTLTAFIVGVVTSLIVRVQYGAQQIAGSNLWSSAGSIAGIVMTFAAVGIASGQAQFIAIVSFTPIVVALANTAWFFSLGRGRAFRPRFRDIGRIEIVALLRLGWRFLAIQILMTLSLSTDAWIVGQAVSLEAATAYSIPARIFAVIGVAVSVLTIPLWPSNAEAIRQGDVAWVRRITRRMTIISPAVAAALAVAGIVWGPAAIDWWLDGAIETPSAFLIGLGAWAVVQAIVAPAFMVQNSVEVLRPQLIGYLLLLIAVPLKFVVASSAGYEFLPFVSVACYCVLIWPAALIGYRRSMAVARRRSERTEGIADEPSRTR
ncbi:MAG: lipopolysaccharide biosynthesis protein [Agromyces sp.]